MPESGSQRRLHAATGVSVARYCSCRLTHHRPPSACAWASLRQSTSSSFTRAGSTASRDRISGMARLEVAPHDQGVPLAASGRRPSAAVLRRPATSNRASSPGLMSTCLAKGTDRAFMPAPLSSVRGRGKRRASAGRCPSRALACFPGYFRVGHGRAGVTLGRSSFKMKEVAFDPNVSPLKARAVRFPRTLRARVTEYRSSRTASASARASRR